jgi:hypothetical protein
MKKPLIGLAVLLAVAGGIFMLSRSQASDDIVDDAIGSSDCAPVVGPTYGETWYRGPLIDTHYHIPNIPENILDGRANPGQPVLGRNVSIADIACGLSLEGTKKVFAFFPVYPGAQAQGQLEVANETMKRYPERFVPFIMAPDGDNDPGGFPTVTADVLREFLDIYPDLFDGFGETGLYRREGGAEELPPDSERLHEIYPLVREYGLVVYFHLGEGQQASFKRTLAANPDINFIFHGDQLIRYTERGQDLSAIDEILSRHPNVYYGIDELYGDEWWLRPEKTNEDFLRHLQNHKALLAEDLATWKGFIERHPNQVLWGTDRSPGVLWSHDPVVGQALSNYGRAFIARLSPSVQENFAYKNAERLLNGR